MSLSCKIQVKGVEPAYDAIQKNAVGRRQEMQTDRRLHVAQGVPHGARPHFRPADADVDDVGDGVPAATAEKAASHVFGEVAEVVQSLRHFLMKGGGHRRITQRRVQCRPVFAHIHDFAGTHLRVRFQHTLFFSQFEESLQILRREALPTDIDRNAAGRFHYMSRTGVTKKWFSDYTTHIV